MNKTITIYELLGLVKDGKAPKKIKYDGDKYTYNDCKDYEIDSSIYNLFETITVTFILNDTVEIIEDNDKLEDNIINADEMKNIGKNLGLAYRKLFEGFKEGWESIEEKLDER